MQSDNPCSRLALMTPPCRWRPWTRSKSSPPQAWRMETSSLSRCEKCGEAVWQVWACQRPAVLAEQLLNDLAGYLLCHSLALVH